VNIQRTFSEQSGNIQERFSEHVLVAIPQVVVKNTAWISRGLFFSRILEQAHLGGVWTGGVVTPTNQIQITHKQRNV
jgi:hypothetical protein